MHTQSQQSDTTGQSPKGDVMQILQFYESNLTNLKSIILKKEEELKEKQLENTLLINLMLNQFHKIYQQFESEKESIVERYMDAMDQIAEMAKEHQQFKIQQFQQQQQQQQQQLPQQSCQHTDYEQKLQELLELRSFNSKLKAQGVGLEVRVKEMEVKLEEQKLRLNEAYMRVDYLEKEKQQLSQQNLVFDQQFKNLLQQFEHYQQISKKQQIQSSHQLSEPSETDLLQTYTQFKKQSSQKQFQQTQQKPFNGIQNFPSEYRGPSAKDLEMQLTNQLQELTDKKQQLESELNKKITSSKTQTEKRKREILESDLEIVIDSINKVKLKLRENKFI